MLSSYEFSQRYNFQSVLWAVARGVYRVGCAVHHGGGWLWSKRRVAGAAIAIPLAVVAAVGYIMAMVAAYLVAQLVRLAWAHREEIGYVAWIGGKALALTGLCVAGFVVVSMIPLAFWAGVAVSAVVSYVGYGVVGK